jgi:hypothetical protein
MSSVLPHAISGFLAGVTENNVDQALKGFALGAVVVDDDVHYRGLDGIRELLVDRASAPSAPSADIPWTIDYAMDSEVRLTTADDRTLQFLLDCGRIAYLRIESKTLAAA